MRTTLTPNPSDPARHPDESQDPFSAGVGRQAISHRSRTNRFKVPVLRQHDQRSAEWMLTFVSMTRQMRLPGAHTSLQVRSAYAAGAVALIDVLDADRALLDASDKLAQARASAARASVAAVRALGGGYGENA